jgi:hypothetical protein
MIKMVIFQLAYSVFTIAIEARQLVEGVHQTTDCPRSNSGFEFRFDTNG